MSDAQQAGTEKKESTGSRQYSESVVRVASYDSLDEAQDSMDKARLSDSIRQQSRALRDKNAESPLTKFKRVWDGY